MYLYIIRDIKDKLYIGISINPKHRVKIHNKSKGANYTKYSNHFKLVYTEEFINLKTARKREIQLKKWSRDKKEALIKKDFERLKESSRKKHL